MSNRAFLLACLALGAYVATWFMWRLVPWAPLTWAAALWAGVMLTYFVVRLGGEQRHLWLNVAAVFLAVSVAEGFLWVRRAVNEYVVPPGMTFEGTYTIPNYFFQMPEAVLGYRPRPGVSVQAIKRFRGQLIYDVHYSVGQNGLRVAPPDRGDPAACVLVFGDSFAWGEAVRDEETAAYQLGALPGHPYRVYNFAFTGYGPHQMLAQIETGMVKKLVDCQGKRMFAVYQTLPNNVARVAGLGGWDRYGPRYVLSRAGEVVRRGRFDEGESILNDRMFVSRMQLRWLGKVQLYSRTLGHERTVNDFDYQRFYAVISRSAHELERQFPGITFVTLLWDDLAERVGGPGSKAWRIREGLSRQGLDVTSIEDVLPNYTQQFNRYHLDNDSHPTAETHRLVANYLHKRFATHLSVLKN